jgi:hypothetical protein
MKVHVAEVEKQLQGSGTPQLAYKKPHAGSTGNIHGLVMMSEQVAVAGMVTGECSTVCQWCHLKGLVNHRSLSHYFPLVLELPPVYTARPKFLASEVASKEFSNSDSMLQV